MTKTDLQKLASLLNSENSQNFPYIQHYDRPLPSLEKIGDMMALLRSIIFPGYFGETRVKRDTMEYHIGLCLEKTYNILAGEIHNSFSFEDSSEKTGGDTAYGMALASGFMDSLPHIKYLLSTDVKAIFDGDPAAESCGEVILCYPSIRALLNHRVAHVLFCLGVPVLPRIIAEMAHFETGIDIHPGAEIGEYFAIDHGTGVVIGKTAIIGNHVKIYQGVTLGAKSFISDETGKLVDIPRHPILEDNVIIYSNTSVLGRITIGANSVIGGNIWLTQSVPPNSKILQQPSKYEEENL